MMNEEWGMRNYRDTRNSRYTRFSTFNSQFSILNSYHCHVEAFIR